MDRLNSLLDIIDQGSQLRLRQGLWHELGDDRDGRLFLGDEIFAPTRPERVHGLVADLELACQHAEHLVVGKAVLALFLGALDGSKHHAQRIAAHGVIGPHRGLKLFVESIAERHRCGTSGRLRVQRLGRANRRRDRSR